MIIWWHTHSHISLSLSYGIPYHFPAIMQLYMQLCKRQQQGTTVLVTVIHPPLLVFICISSFFLSLWVWVGVYAFFSSRSLSGNFETSNVTHDQIGLILQFSLPI